MSNSYRMNVKNLQSSRLTALCFCALILEGNLFIVRRLFGLSTVELENWIVYSAALTLVSGVFMVGEFFFKKEPFSRIQ